MDSTTTAKAGLAVLAINQRDPISVSIEDDQIHLWLDEGSFELDFDRPEGMDNTVRWRALGADMPVSVEEGLESFGIEPDPDLVDALIVDTMYAISAVAYGAAADAVGKLTVTGPQRVIATLADGRWTLRCPHCGSSDLYAGMETMDYRDIWGDPADAERPDTPIIHFGSTEYGDTLDDGTITCRHCLSDLDYPTDYEPEYL